MTTGCILFLVVLQQVCTVQNSDERWIQIATSADEKPLQAISSWEPNLLRDATLLSGPPRKIWEHATGGSIADAALPELSSEEIEETGSTCRRLTLLTWTREEVIGARHGAPPPWFCFHGFSSQRQGDGQLKTTTTTATTNNCAAYSVPFGPSIDPGCKILEWKL